MFGNINNNVGNARGVAVFPFNGMDTWNMSLGKTQTRPISKFQPEFKIQLTNFHKIFIIIGLKSANSVQKVFTLIYA